MRPQETISVNYGIIHGPSFTPGIVELVQRSARNHNPVSKEATARNKQYEAALLVTTRVSKARESAVDPSQDLANSPATP